MGARRVVGPGDRVWRVGRRWVGDPPRLPRRELDGGGDGGAWADLFDFGLDDSPLAAIAAALLAVAVIVALFTAIWPLIALTIELVIIVVLLVAGIVGRVLFRRPWTVEARSQRLAARWQVSGWRASSELVEQISSRIAAGEDPRRIEPSLRDQDQLHVRG